MIMWTRTQSTINGWRSAVVAEEEVLVVLTDVLMGTF